MVCFLQTPALVHPATVTIERSRTVVPARSSSSDHILYDKSRRRIMKSCEVCLLVVMGFQSEIATSRHIFVAMAKIIVSRLPRLSGKSSDGVSSLLGGYPNYYEWL